MRTSKNIYTLNNYQYGGSTKKLVYKDKEFKFKFDKSDSSITIYREKLNGACILIFINSEERFAYIHDLSYYPECSKPNTKSGTEILLVSLKFLKKYKEKYGIDRVVLTDNSLKYIKGCKDPVILTRNYFLLNNDTWYGKFGFKPYDITLNKPNKQNRKEYKNNRNRIKETKVKDYLYFIRKYLSVSDKDKELNISVFLNKLMKQHDNCKVNIFIEKLFIEMKLFDFHLLGFYLDL
jgi:hypothetical protein